MSPRQADLHLIISVNPVLLLQNEKLSGRQHIASSD